MGRLFTFRLDPVLEIRRSREEQLQGEFAQAISAVADQQLRVTAAQDALAVAVKQARTMAEQPVQLLELRAINDEIARLRRVVAHEKDMVERLEGIAEERREELVQASRDREALDGLRERAENAFRVEENRREQDVLDELATRRARRGHDGTRGPSPTGAAA